MWNFLAREAAKRIGGSIAANKIVGVDEANGPEAFADRIKRDFRLRDYADARALYDFDRSYWEDYYHPRPNDPAWDTDFVRDSAAAAGVPGRNNVSEYGFPEPNPVQPSMREVPQARMGNRPAWNADMVRDSAAGAGVSSRNNVFEYGFPEGNAAQSSIVPAPSPQMSVFAAGAPAISFSPATSESGPRGLPALLAETDAFDPLNSEWPAGGGLPGLIREYLRNK